MSGRGAKVFKSKTADIMTADCKRVREDTLAAEAMAIFHKYRIDELPVVNGGDEPVGLSAGGSYVYWNLCNDRFVGSADLSIETSLPQGNVVGCP